MKRWKKATLITLGIILLLAGLVAFALPVIVKSQAAQRMETATGRKLEIGGLSINPLTFTVAVRDFRLSERGSRETFAAFSSAQITISPLSIYRFAPIIASARINAPNFRIVRIRDNVYNFSDLLKWLPRVPHLSVNDLKITNGSVDIIDMALQGEKRHELHKIELAVPFITTMKNYADRYITPSLSAVLNGSPLHAEGRFRPFPRVVEAAGTVEFKDLPLPFYLAYVPLKLPVRVESGMISAKIEMNYRAKQLKEPDLSLNGSVTLVDLKVADLTGAPFLSLVRFEAEISRALLLTGELDLSSLSTDGVEVFLTRDKKGSGAIADLPSRPSKAPPRAGKRLSA